MDTAQLFTLVSGHVFLSSRTKVFIKMKYCRVHFSSCTNTLKLGICDISEPSHRQMRLLSSSHFPGAEEELDGGRGRKEARVVWEPMTCSPLSSLELPLHFHEEYEESVFVLHRATPHALMEQSLVRSCLVQWHALGSRNNMIANVAGNGCVQRGLCWE